MKSVLVVITARPSFARVKTALDALASHEDCRLLVAPVASSVLTRTGNVAQRFKEYENTYPISCVVEGDSLVSSVKTTGALATELSTLFHFYRPDCVVTIGDRHETLGTAIAATYLNIPLAHIQGGEVSGNIDNRVRNAVTMLADYHFPATDMAGNRIDEMVGEPRYLEVVGCPSIDMALEAVKSPLTRDQVEGGDGSLIALEGFYTVLLQHPVTTEPDQAYTQMWASLEACRLFGRPCWVIAPNLDAGTGDIWTAIRTYQDTYPNFAMRVMRRLEPEALYRLVKGAVVLVGNSSLGIRECSALGVPVVNVGNRQQGRERANNVIDVLSGTQDILSAMRKWESDTKSFLPLKSDLYGTGDAGTKIATTLMTWLEA